VVNEVLLGIFDEILNGTADRMKEIQDVIERRKTAIAESQQGIQIAEERLKCATYEDERALQKIDVLSAYLVRSGKNAQVLMAKVRDLTEARGRTKEVRRSAEEQVVVAKSDLHSKRTLVAVAEQEYAELQGRWKEVSEMASQERTNAAA
jgi:small-conductance mechanosensitive channel